ncbi:MAG TPA: mismatch repair protein [Acidobacteriaceae bacterium]|nr:mismatch repair protein [Acidobacteriaceae bacterium]
MPQGEPQAKSQAEVWSGPEAEYRSRLSALEREQTELHESDRRYVGLKLVLLAALVIVAAWLVKYAPGRLPWLAVIVAVLVVVFVLHERVLRGIRTVRQRKGFYERGLARLEGRWAGTGRTGEQFLDQSHPYARDLDLFGEAGLFELLCTARTSAGERLLADWLLAAAPIDEITRRQTAVRELAPQTDFQERMALAGEDIQTEGARTPEALANWAEAGNKVRNPAWLRFGALALAVGWAASVLLWLLSRLGGVPLWEWGWVAAGLTVLNGALSYAGRKETAEAAEALEAAGEELPLLAAVFAAIEREDFRSEKLAGLQARMRAAGETPSRAIAKLNDYREWIVGAHNLMVQAVDPVVFWSRQWVWAAERWRARYGAAVREWMSAAAEIEALLSLAIFAREHPEYVFPEFAPEGPYLEAEDLAHPLVLGRAVGNDVKLGRAPGEDSQGLRLIIISGPNMAGKSTFTRSVGVNAVLAQAGAPVRARRMVLSELQVAASICVLDSLAGGLSRFYAEITRLKQIYDLTGRDLPVLFLLDELLSGTNSHDRRVGTDSIVRGLLRHRAIGIVTTHDLALTEIVGTLNGTAANYHFGDTFRDGKLSFDYLLSPGIAETTNALQLMQSIGLTGE